MNVAKALLTAQIALDELHVAHRCASWTEALAIFTLVTQQEAIIDRLKEMDHAQPPR